MKLKTGKRLTSYWPSCVPIFPAPPTLTTLYIHLDTSSHLTVKWVLYKTKAFLSAKYSLPVPHPKIRIFCTVAHDLPGTYLIVGRPDTKGTSVPNGQRFNMGYFSSIISSFLEINSSSLYWFNMLSLWCSGDFTQVMRTGRSVTI